jgi:hypothetical protein
MGPQLFFATILLAELVVAATATTSTGQPAPEKSAIAGCGWSSHGTRLGPDYGLVGNLLVWDDGSGPALYAAGSRMAGGVVVNAIARWDGSTWSPLSGPAGTGIDGRVGPLAIFNDGNGEALYVGGHFTSAGGLPASNIARWDGSTWSAPNGVEQPVYTLAVYDDGTGSALYAGGELYTLGYLARWDGSGWSALTGASGTGLNGRVNSLAVWDDGNGPALYAGGYFDTADGITVNGIARWDGATWSALTGAHCSGVDDGWVYSMIAWDDGRGEALYVAGSFSSAGGTAVNKIGRWDGTAWEPLLGPSGNGFSTGSIYDLVVWNDGSGAALYAGGSFGLVDGKKMLRIARWDSAEWSALHGPTTSGMDNWVSALAVYNDGNGEALYAGGAFDNAGGLTAIRVARWDRTTWSPVSFGPPDIDRMLSLGFPTDLAVYDDGNGEAIYVGGTFMNAGRYQVNRIARWDGNKWLPLTGPSGTGLPSTPIGDMAVFDNGSGPALYVGCHTGGIRERNAIVSWNGEDWSPLLGTAGGSISGGSVNAMVVWDNGSGPSLNVGGGFTRIEGFVANGLARWDGRAWSPIGFPMNGVLAMTVFDDGDGEQLYVVGSNPPRPIKWDGSSWSGLHDPSGLGIDSGRVDALAVLDDGSGPALYAAGAFNTAGGIEANNIARWDGRSWSALAGPAGVGTDSRIFDLRVWDDGGGPALYVAGTFKTAGGVTVNHIAKWHGGTWSPLWGHDSVGAQDFVYSLVTFDDGNGQALYAGGSFDEIGDVTTGGLASWRCSRADCGDAPDPYPTRADSNGAWHTVSSGLHLGAGVDTELDGQPHPVAAGDDSDGNDDEDGVLFITELLPGLPAKVAITSSRDDALLDAWIDFNGDGTWDGSKERLFTAARLAGGQNVLEFRVPATAAGPLATFARFRLSSTGVAGPTGGTADGEVEDYAVEIGQALFTAEKEVNGALHEGGMIAYTIMVGNSSDSSQADNPGDELRDLLPPELLLVDACLLEGSGQISVQATDNRVSWNGTIPPGERVVVEIEAMIRKGTTGLTVSNQAEILFDFDGDGNSEGMIISDDPTTSAVNDATTFIVASPIPVLYPGATLLLIGVLTSAGYLLVRRR